ncbi:hypothetical protein GCM10010913_13870 [Paenibacillus aceti]|uniref:Uncharacterized protein n=1 Tax=Paenibacillus aceti TaxID=1820010 RepID=A0ABQ1VRY8_9BACL|nr:hypothetical protein GCM10010913_13870 [Paenibacillus aceti]
MNASGMIVESNNRSVSLCFKERSPANPISLCPVRMLHTASCPFKFVFYYITLYKDELTA